MAAQKRNQKVVKMKKQKPVFTGVILLLFSFYVIFLLLQSLTKEHLSIYEVTEKKIADDNTVRGIIIRDEKLVTSTQSGYVNYYIGEGAKVGVKTPIYSVDANGKISDQLTASKEEEIKLTAQNTEDIRSDISAFQEAYKSSHFEETYNFKYNIENTISELSNASMMNSLTQILEENGSVEEFKLVRAKESGIISFTSDGMEDIDLNSITAESFENTTDNLTQLRQTESIEEGTPVYKLVSSENWSIVAPLSKEQFKNIQQQDRVVVSLKKIQTKISPQITTFTMDGGYYVKMDLNRYMIQYLNNRYLDIEIELNDNEGLKIPLSSIVKKSFYKIPADFLTQNKDKEYGVSVVEYQKNGEVEYPHKVVDYIMENEMHIENSENSTYCYIDASAFPAGTMITKHDASGETINLSETVELEGVYCCNNGYCEFKLIEQTYKNLEYCIIHKESPNGLSAYEHIILNPELINENDIIY